jgi:hypothetical protein
MPSQLEGCQQESEMGFLQRAREAASQVTEQAHQAAERAGDGSGQGSLHEAMTRAKDHARGAADVARRGVRTVIEKIDPATLADVVIKATALQELTNRALADKRSPYRISGISISASVPPGITFSIGRVDDGRHAAGEQRSSQEILASGDSAEILSLEGNDTLAAAPPAGTTGAV